MKFSENKFRSLPEKRQIKKIIDLCYLIDKNWIYSELINDYLENLKSYLGWVSDNKIENFSNLQRKLTENLSQRDFLQLFVPYEQKHSSTLMDHKIIIKSKDKNSCFKTIFGGF